MSIATTVTLGYSISGGLQAGTDTLPTLGYGIAEVVVVPAAQYISLEGTKNASISINGTSSASITLEGTKNASISINGTSSASITLEGTGTAHHILDN